MIASESISRRRARTLILWLGLAAMALIGRLGFLQLDQGPKLAAAAQLERVHYVPIAALRGPILDRSGRILAVDATGYVVSADPEIMTPAQRSTAARALAPALAQPVGRLMGLLRLKLQYVVLDPDLSPVLAQRLARLALPGVDFTPQERRRYPEGALFGPVVGFVGADGQGLAGVEETYQRQLAGRPGLEREVLDAAGNPLPERDRVLRPPRNGDTLVLTLSATIQALAERALVAEIHRAHARSGRVIVLDPRTGGVLAMAQWPSADPNHPGRYPPADWRNQSVEEAFPPGSTFKPVTAAAALMAGIITPKSEFYDPGYKVVTGHMFHGWEWPNAFGWLNFDHAVALSSDIAFMDIGLKLGARRLLSYARRIHVATPTGIDLPGESPGVWLPLNRIRPMDLATMAFGQTEAVTAIQLASAVAAVADGGVWHRPHVGRELIAPDGRIVRRIGAGPGQRVMSRKVSAEIVKAMTDVVRFGTGTAAKIRGYTMAGKTGTAQLLLHGTFGHHLYMASFVEYGPIPHPRVLVLVQVNDPVGQIYGAEVGAPVAKRIMAETLSVEGILPQRPAPLPAGSQRSVPGFVGAPLATAMATAQRAGLALLVRGRGERVVSQLPLPGDPRPLSGLVQVSVAQSVYLARRVPSALGLSLGEAQALFRAQGLEVRARGAGEVRSQRPRAGTPVRPGMTVELTLRPPPVAWATAP